MTYFTWDQDIRQEIHFNCLVTVTATSFATSSGHIEWKTSRFIAAYLRFGQIDKKISYIRKDSGIRCRIGTGCSSQRRLVYVHHLVYIFQPFYAVVCQRVLQGAIKMLRQDRLQSIIDQGGFPTARHPCHTDKFSQWKLHIHIFQVVSPRTLQP